MGLIKSENSKNINAQKYILWPNPWGCIICSAVVIDRVG